MKNNPFLLYLSNPKIEFIGKGKDVQFLRATAKRELFYQGKVQSFTDKIIIIKDKKTKKDICFAWKDVKIILTDIRNAYTDVKLINKIKELNFDISYKSLYYDEIGTSKPYIRNKNNDIDNFTIYDINKLNLLLINEGIHVGLIPEKYICWASLYDPDPHSIESGY